MVTQIAKLKIIKLSFSVKFFCFDGVVKKVNVLLKANNYKILIIPVVSVWENKLIVILTGERELLWHKLIYSSN